ncbi:MAG: plasmid stabilization protein [Ottowia sp.]|nr:plasmid stabilization protein [Ottowia sp.]
METGRVVVINYSGNVGKSTIAKHLLAPRMRAERIDVESINAGASDGSEATERYVGNQFREVQDRILEKDNVIVDVGASNVEEYMRLMRKFRGSHDDVDYFVVPAVPDDKQVGDTINTIMALSDFGVPPEKIRLVFNKVDEEKISSFDNIFSPILGFHESEKRFTLDPDAIIFSSDIFSMLRPLQKTLSDVLDDKTDYRQQLKQASTSEEKQDCLDMIAAKRLALSASENLDHVYRILFKS